MATLYKSLSALALVGLLAFTPAKADPAPEPKVAALDDSKWLLPDAEYFVKFNVKQMMASDLMTKGGTAAMKEAIKGNEQLKAVLDATELDLTKDIDSLVVTGIGTNPKDAKGLFVVRGSFKKDKVHDALKKAAEKDEKLKLVKEGDLQMYEMTGQKDQSVFAAFADGNTIVATQSKEATAEAVKNGGKKAAAQNKAMKAAMGKFTGKESMTMVVVVNEEMKKQLANVPQHGANAAKLASVSAAVTLTEDVSMKAVGQTGEAKSAKALSQALEGFKAIGALMVGGQENVPAVVGDILQAIKITADKEAVLVDLKITKEMIEKAQKPGGGE